MADDNISGELTRLSLSYVELHGGPRCVVCGATINEGDEVYVVPTTHDESGGAYALTLTFSCPGHRRGVGSAFFERLVTEAKAGIVWTDSGLDTDG